VRAVAAVSDVPMTLLTRNPAIKTLADFTAKDRISVAAVKTSMTAITLQMAAAKLWGDENYQRLDKLTVSMRRPDAAVAMLSGHSQVNTDFTAPPYDFMQQKDPAIRPILDSYDVYGGPATLILLYCTKKFYDANPKVNSIVVAAMEDADKLIKANPKRAAQIYLEATKEKISLEDMVAMITNPKTRFKLAPSNIYPTAVFLHKIGRIKHLPASWKGFFFESAHSLPGS
jgi:NitT/TauT family transport system substrate-binding protein